MPPKLWEVKKVYQYVSFEAVDLSRGVVTLRNKYAFTNLGRFGLRWSLSADGTVIQEGRMVVPDIAPIVNAHIPTCRIAQRPLDCPLPRLRILRRPETIYDYRFEDFELLDYAPHAHIAAPVAV